MVVRSTYVADLKRWTWCLRVERTATEADLQENHYLEQLGDSIWSVVVGISHCPYCGERLEEGPESRSVPASEFRLVDSRGWTGEYL